MKYIGITDFLFVGIEDQKAAELLKEHTITKTFKKGETVTEKGRNSLGLIISGTAQAMSGNVIKRKFKEGSVFGAASIFSSIPYISKVIATSDCTIMFIRETSLLKLFLEDMTIATNYICFLSEKICFLNRRIDQLAGRDTASKLYKYLCDNMDRENVYEISNMSALSKALGIGRSSLYRCFEKLEDDGAIKKTNNKVKVI